MGIEALKIVTESPRRLVRWFLHDPGIQIVYYPSRRMVLKPEIGNGQTEEDRRVWKRMQLWRQGRSSVEVERNTALTLIRATQILKGLG